MSVKEPIIADFCGRYARVLGRYPVFWTYNFGASELHPIRAYRDRHGLSMRQLVERCGVTVPALSRIEGGLIECPNMRLIVSLSRATGGEVSEVDIFRWHLAHLDRAERSNRRRQLMRGSA
jgi:predicted transcriptional regulator